MTDRQPILLDPESHESLLDEALQVLDAGGLVCVPTETVYGIGGRADRPAALAALRALKKGRDAAFTLHVASARDAFSLGQPTPAAERLARAYWPGPLTLVLDATEQGTKYAMASDGTVGLRVVAHEFTRSLCERAGAPLLLSSANAPGAPPASDAVSAFAAVGSSADLTIDAGPCVVAAPSSVVRLGAGGKIDVLREGALARAGLLARAATLVLFVCSGNTCRSPMAEVLARRKWSEALGVESDALIEHGILVASAGVSALPGMPAATNAIKATAEIGLDLTYHRSRPIEPALLARASRILGMGPSHIAAVHAMLEAAGGPFDGDAHPPALLAEGGIGDPFGADLDGYRRVRDRIADALPEGPGT